MKYDLDTILKEIIIQASKAGCKPNRINPTVIINHRAKTFWGRCRWNMEKEWYDIEVTEQLLDASLEHIKNTIAHEVLHACKGGHTHKGQWKENAKIMNRKYGYNIKRCTSYEEKGVEINVDFKYIIKCMGCGKETGREKMSGVVKQPENYICRCGGKLIRVK